MIDPEIKAKWLEALRSGRYVQGIGTLRNDMPPTGAKDGSDSWYPARVLEPALTTSPVMSRVPKGVI